MAHKTHTSQKDPPEGSRDVVERELERAKKQSDGARNAEGDAPQSDQPDRGRDRPGESGRSGQGG
jgi:hypothetical protein